MFTGLVEEIGRLARVERRGVGARVTVETSLSPLVLGESIAVDGVCLTVARISTTGFEADASVETLERTTLGGRAPGAPVHLERATPVGGRLGGHLVMGHVDAFATVTEATPRGAGTATEAWRLGLRLPRGLAPFVAEKGSLAVDGVSLTLNAVRDGGEGVDVELMIVPHTLGATKLGRLAPGDRVNVEVDVLARYVARQLTLSGSKEAGPHEPGADERLRDKLREAGYG